MNKKIIPIIFICILGAAIVPQIAGARIVPECGAKKGCGICEFFLLVMNIYDYIAFKLTPPMAGVLIIFAGALFLFSGGSEERVNQAKKIFINIIFGLIFIYASWLIVNSIIMIVGKKVDGFDPKTWNEFNCTSN